jgi:hypothetical protein
VIKSDLQAWIRLACRQGVILTADPAFKFQVMELVALGTTEHQSRAAVFGNAMSHGEILMNKALLPRSMLFPVPGFSPAW